MNIRRFFPRFSFRAALLFAALSLAVPAGRAFADGEDEGESVEAKVKAQIDKIIKLMRENEKALLEASRGSGKKPEGGPDVKIPVEPGMESTSPSGGEKPPEGEAPPLKGEDVRKRLDQLLKTSEESGASIPKELEELVKLIPVMKSQSQSQGEPPPPDPKPGESGSTEPRNANREPKPDEGKDQKGAPKPQNPAEKPGERSDVKPPDGDKADPNRTGQEPPWLVALPEEYRRMITSGDTEHVPQRYKHLIEVYAKWLADHAKDGTGR